VIEWRRLRTRHLGSSAKNDRRAFQITATRDDPGDA
jgi:hypothetical protein